MSKRSYCEGHNISSRGVQIMREAFEEAVHRLDGLERFTLPDGVTEAAVNDGRPYELFLAELIRLGLRQHNQKSQGLT